MLFIPQIFVSIKNSHFEQITENSLLSKCKSIILYCEAQTLTRIKKKYFLLEMFFNPCDTWTWGGVHICFTVTVASCGWIRSKYALKYRALEDGGPTLSVSSRRVNSFPFFSKWSPVCEAASGGSPQTLSTHMAMPIPPPMHRDATPLWPPVLSSACSRVTSTLQPDMPSGWPREMAPPLTFTWGQNRTSGLWWILAEHLHLLEDPKCDPAWRLRDTIIADLKKNYGIFFKTIPIFCSMMV